MLRKLGPSANMRWKSMALALAASILAGNAQAQPADYEASAIDDLEITIMLGRFPTMLEQARDILRLPTPAGEQDLAAEAGRGGSLTSSEVWGIQYQLAVQFLNDTHTACQRQSTPPALRTIACGHASQTADDILNGDSGPAPYLDAQSLSARNDALLAAIGPWWNAACARRAHQCPSE